MKRIWICMGSVILWAHTATAQIKKLNDNTPLQNRVIQLNSISENLALADINSSSEELPRLRIDIPYIDVLQTRAKGEDPDVKNVEILGMPKGAYGFANGRLRVFPVSSTSSGTLTGTGAVATGSHPGSIGSVGISPGVNGKNAFAGTGMWGHARGLVITRNDLIPTSGSTDK